MVEYKLFKTIKVDMDLYNYLQATKQLSPNESYSDIIRRNLPDLHIALFERLNQLFYGLRTAIDNFPSVIEYSYITQALILGIQPIIETLIFKKDKNEALKMAKIVLDLLNEGVNA